MNVLKKNKGFTLVELIVVIAIIGILAAVLVPSLTSYITKARESSAIQEAKGVYDIYTNYIVEVQAGNLEADEDTFTKYYNKTTKTNKVSVWDAYKDPVPQGDPFQLVEVPNGYKVDTNDTAFTTPDYFVYKAGSINVKITVDGIFSIAG